MAGSGKTTFMQRLSAWVRGQRLPSYLVNLDPAVRSVPYSANIDIRDTIDYQKVMEQYRLGPNGGILTALNLFSTKFDGVISLIEGRKHELEYVFVDTPGQIEVFSWSASGQIISESLAASYPTVLLFVVDTPRCSDPVTFMSNMTYAASILYKSKLPFLLSVHPLHSLTLSLSAFICFLAPTPRIEAESKFLVFPTALPLVHCALIADCTQFGVQQNRYSLSSRRGAVDGVARRFRSGDGAQEIVSELVGQGDGQCPRRLLCVDEQSRSVGRHRTGNAAVFGTDRTLQNAVEHTVPTDAPPEEGAGTQFGKRATPQNGPTDRLRRRQQHRPSTTTEPAAPNREGAGTRFTTRSKRRWPRR